MKDHEKRELIEELVGIARIANGTDQLRERIAYALDGMFLNLSEALARAEKAERELQATQQRFESQCALWKPVDDYARKHPEMLLGNSVPEHALRLMQERDAGIVCNTATKAVLAKVQADLQAALDRENAAREQKPIGHAVAANKDSAPGYTVVVFCESDVPPGTAVYASPILAPAAQVPQAIPQEWRDCLVALETLFSPLAKDCTQAVWIDKARALIQQSEVKS